MKSKEKKNGGLLGFIERAGNKLPHPIYIFLILCAVIMVISAFMSGTEISHPGTGDVVTVNNLLSRDGIVWILQNIVSNFVKFPPLGMVLVMMIGLGLAEETGLLRTVLRKVIVGSPRKLISFVIVFAGIMGNIAGSATFVVIPPLGGMIFQALGRNPMLGISAGFAGVAAGLSANLLVTPTDILLSGITETAAQIMDANFTVHPAVNWFFMIASTVVLSLIGLFVIERVLEPRLGNKKTEQEIKSEEDIQLMEITPLENKGLRNAGIVSIIYLIGILALIVPKNGLLRNPETGGLIPSPFLSSMVPILLFWFIAAAIAYGVTVKTIENSNDVIKHMTKSMESFAGFIVLCFFAAQFVEFFSYTNLGLLLAVKGATFLQVTGLTGVPLIVLFILLVCLINFFIGSSSAKWALLAPIFVPMFMEIGLSPYFTQAAYRIADSVTNSISPLEPFMPFIIATAQKYDKDAGLGTVISTMLPYAVSFLIGWTLLLIAWYVFKIPLGPGASIFM